MESNYKKSKIPYLLVLLFFIAFASHKANAQAVTEIITDYNGYWKSGVGALNPIKPENNHDLLSFSFNGTRYSTGVNDALLTSNGQIFIPQDFKALPMQNMKGTPTDFTFIGVGQLYDGVDNGASNPPPINNLPLYLTDGVKGLNIGTCATNIPVGSVSFSISNIDPLTIGDGVPDILITQVAQPSGTTDVYRFKDADGNVIGNPINIVLNNITPVGNWIADFYRVLSTPMIIPPGFVKTERPIRLWAADLSDFGITAANYASISSFVINLNGTSDIAFVAYNFATADIVPLTPGLSVLKEGTFTDTNNDCIASVGDVVNYTFKVTNTGETPLTNITLTDANAILSGAPINLAAGASNSTNFTGTHILTAADIAAGAVYNIANATATAPAPINAVTATSQDPTPISTTSPFYNPNCEFCTVVVLPTATSVTIASTIQPNCTLATGSVTLNGLPAGNYTINPGGIVASGSSYTISGLTAGTYNFTVTNAAGCISPSLSVTINSQPATPSAPVVDLVTNPTCTVTTGSVVLSGLPVGPWTINPGDITGSGATYTISNLPAGTFTFTVTNAIGCISPASATVTILAPAEAPSAPIVGSITNPTCAVNTGAVLLSGLPIGNYTINPGNIQGSTPTFNVTNLAPGTYNFTITNEAGCISTASIDVVISAAPNAPIAPIVDTILQPTCTLTTGSVTLSGLPSGDYTINPGNIAVTGSVYTISELAPGTYNFTVTNAEGCISSASIDVVINVAPPAISAPIVGTVTNPTCTVNTGTVVLSGLPSGTYTINPGNISGSTESFTITNLAPGTYNFTVTSAEGCTSEASSEVVITAAPDAPIAPVVASVTNTSCSVNTGTVVLSGLPTGTYTVNPGNITGSESTLTITDLAAGTYNFTVTNAAECISSASVEVIINDAPLTPNAPIVGEVTNPTCTINTGTVVLSGLPTGLYTINPGNINGSGETFTVTNLAAGTYNFSVTNADGCISSDSTSVVITAVPNAPVTPIISTVVNATCTLNTGSVTLSGLPNGSYTINPGNIVTTGNTYTITGLSAGTYNFSVTNSEGCNSPFSADAVIGAAPDAPSAPIVGTVTGLSCTLNTGSVVLSGLPAGNYTINPGNISGSGDTFTVSGLTAGTYNFSVTNAEGCISTSSIEVVINAAPSAPSAPIVGDVTNPTCAQPTGSVVLSGLPAGVYTINPGSIIGEGSTLTITGLTAGTYNFTVTSAEGCISDVSTDLVIVPVNDTLVLASDIANCNLATDAIFNLDTLFLTTNEIPLGGVWTATGLPEGKLVGSVFTALNVPVGDYLFTYTYTSDTCSGKVLLTITVDDDCAVEPAGDCAPPVVRNAFSPNNDGVNDVFTIDNIQDTDCYNTTSVEIYNRWGVLVYETQQYDNNVKAFTGYSEGRATVGNSSPLPTGTYFYILKYTVALTGQAVQKDGYLYLSR